MARTSRRIWGNCFNKVFIDESDGVKVLALLGNWDTALVAESRSAAHDRLIDNKNTRLTIRPRVLVRSLRRC